MIKKGKKKKKKKEKERKGKKKKERKKKKACGHTCGSYKSENKGHGARGHAGRVHDCGRAAPAGPCAPPAPGQLYHNWEHTP